MHSNGIKWKTHFSCLYVYHETKGLIMTVTGSGLFMIEAAGKFLQLPFA